MVEISIVISEVDIDIVPTELVVEIGNSGVPGQQGEQGEQGLSNITSSTATTLTGYLKGDGSVVSGSPTVPMTDVTGVLSPSQIPNRVDIFTTSAMSATYNNGTAGVGATLTAVGNITTLDSASLSVGNIVAFAAQATPLQNGIYECLTTGAGAQFRRVTWFDSSAEMVNGFTFFVARGANAGQWKRITTSQPYTVGVSTISFSDIVNNLANTAGNLVMSGRTVFMGAASATTGGGNLWMAGGAIRNVDEITDYSGVQTVSISNHVLANTSGVTLVNFSGGAWAGHPLQFNSAANHNAIFGAPVMDSSSYISLSFNDRQLYDYMGNANFQWNASDRVSALIPLGLPSLYDYQTTVDSLYYSLDISALAWKDTGGTVHNLQSGGSSSIPGSSGAIVLSNGTGGATEDYNFFNWDSSNKRLTIGQIYTYSTAAGIIFNPPYGGSGNFTGVFAPDYFYGAYPLKLPEYDGASGEILSTNGTGQTSWVAATVNSAGSSGDVQINNGSGGFSAVAGMTTSTIPVAAVNPGELNSITFTNGILTSYTTL